MGEGWGLVGEQSWLAGWESKFLQLGIFPKFKVLRLIMMQMPVRS